jgi:putative ABC transport system permease protein
VQTPDGTKEVTVMAILNQVPFSDSVNSLTTFVTTEKLFKELTGESTFKIIDIHTDSGNTHRYTFGYNYFNY